MRSQEPPRTNHPGDSQISEPAATWGDLRAYDAVELHRRVTTIEPDIAIATVCRTLSLLQDNGILERHTFADDGARHVTADQKHHDHFIDVETGDVMEFWSEDISRKHGFETVCHKLKIYV